jgi:AraC family transcriptional regulator of adaptative response/methylated-DNA-[protein]-cysteine methyltransferase
MPMQTHQQLTPSPAHPFKFDRNIRIARRAALRYHGGMNENHENHWQAVLARDAGADGAFVYAVRSTGIYCKPSCASRRPRRAQVTFFAGPDEAERAGYRACRRCRPREAAAEGDAVARVCAYIDAHPDERVTLAALAAHAGYSPAHLQRAFKRRMGISPRAYADARRAERLRAALRAEDSVTGAVYAAGYGASSRVYENAPLGMTPATYRRGGQGMEIHYTIVDSALGRLLVGATERGLCAVSLGANDTALERALAHEYPAAARRRDDAGLGAWAQAIVAGVAAGRPPRDLPLDVQGTAFQRRVWEALRAIPPGETRAYGELARALGQPAAARAVAGACAANHVALVIPCHRVVRGDGELGGYKWGVERKEQLLAREKQPAP